MLKISPQPLDIGNAYSISYHCKTSLAKSIDIASYEFFAFEPHIWAMPLNMLNQQPNLNSTSETMPDDTIPLTATFGGNAPVQPPV